MCRNVGILLALFAIAVNAEYANGADEESISGYCGLGFNPMDARLVGVVMEASSSYVILETSTGCNKVLAVGHSLADGYVVAKISSNGVEILHGNEVLRLKLKGLKRSQVSLSKNINTAYVPENGEMDNDPSLHTPIYKESAVSSAVTLQQDETVVTSSREGVNQNTINIVSEASVDSTL